MHVDCWIQQVTTRVGAVTCWIQQSVSPKQVVGFSCLFNSEVDQLISKAIVFVYPAMIPSLIDFLSLLKHWMIHWLMILMTPLRANHWVRLMVVMKASEVNLLK